MCVPNFSCPLCCNEKFESINSLKYHILSLIENLLCPICSKRFDKIIDLAEHLSQDCRINNRDNSIDLNENEISESNAKEQIQNAQNIKTEFIINEDNNSSESNNVTLHISEDDFAETSIKFEQDIGDSILARALLSNRRSTPISSSTSNDSELNVADSPQDETNEESPQFFCQLCNMSLDSIEEHLEKFHAGQEVLVQPDCIEEDEEEASEMQTTQLSNTEPNKDASSQEDESSYYIIDGTNIGCLIENGEEEEIDPEEPEQQPAKKLNTFKETSETIAEEVCVDKDGRVYTRKVVKIGQFWNQPSDEKKKSREPMIEKFIIDDDGKPKKITEQEEQSIEDKDSIITLHICPICYLQYSELQNFYAHTCNMNASKRYICSECDSEFYGPRALCAHMKLHSKSKNRVPKEPRVGPFNCELCKTQFRTFKSLRLHTRMHEPIKERQIEPPVSYEENKIEQKKEVRETFICPVCNKVFDKQYESIHLNSHSGRLMNFDCNICNRKLHTQANLDMHMKAHSNTKKFACSYCKKPFVTYDALTEHLSQQCQKRQYECQFCGRRFARPHEKVKHERIHTGEKPHICELCGKSFRVSYCLTLHMRTHSGMRPYHCDHCGKRFKSHSVFNHHLLTHSKERKYKCPFCPKAFKTSVQLAGHKNSHTKPFTCTECNRPFASLYAVRTHMETHKRNNNLKFDCWICGASYARTFALRDHMKEQHDHDEKMSTTILNVTEEIDATNSILSVVPDDDILMDIGSTENAASMENIEAVTG